MELIVHDFYVWLQIFLTSGLFSAQHALFIHDVVFT